jgi:hypothetical protein
MARFVVNTHRRWVVSYPAVLLLNDELVASSTSDSMASKIAKRCSTKQVHRGHARSRRGAVVDLRDFLVTQCLSRIVLTHSPGSWRPGKSCSFEFSRLFHPKFGSQAFDHTEQRGPLRMVRRKVQYLARKIGDRLLLGSGSKLHL